MNTPLAFRVFMVVAMCLPGPAASAQEAAPAVTVENASSHALISPPAYGDYVRESRYIEMSDGVRLAADIFRPAHDGAVETEPLPLVWTHHRYVRARAAGARRVDMMSMPPIFGTREFVRRGYIVAAVDVRGGGASFGTFDAPFSPRETADAAEIIDWFAAQPWCDGNIGMYGGSYLGATQYMAAATKSPHLKALIPSVAPADLYAFSYAGGIYRQAFMDEWTSLTVMLDTSPIAAPVDDDPDGILRDEAMAAHAANRKTAPQFAALPYRDSIDEPLGLALHAATSPLTRLDEIEASGVAIYHIGGWMDLFPRDTLVLYGNLGNRQRLAMGPWFHQERYEFDNSGEHVRWFDRWLKGIDNGIDREPPIHYYVMGAAPGERWRTSWTWPLENETPTRLYFRGGADDPSDNRLSRDAPAAGAPPVTYAVDYTTTSGTANRWRNGHGGPPGDGNMTLNDTRGIGFTTDVLIADVEVTGHPVVELWITSTADDGDFFVYLEEIEADGTSRYVTEGCLRASHRATAEPPHEYFGLPYHRSFKADVAPLGDEPARLAFDLHPTSNVFDAGHRIRVTITCADHDNQETPIIVPVPVVTVLCDDRRSSSIVLPVIPTP